MTLSDIITMVAAYYGLSEQTLLTSRNKTPSLARQIIAKLGREHTQCTHASIADALGWSDYLSVIRSITAINKRISQDDKVKADYATISAYCHG